MAQQGRFLLLLFSILLMAGAVGLAVTLGIRPPTPTPSSDVTSPSPSAITPTPTPTATPTSTPTPTATPAATSTPTATPTSTPTPTATPTAMSTPTVTPTPISTSTATSTPMPTLAETLPPQQPWNPQTPVPPARPGYNPHVGCVISPCAPAPQLEVPENSKEARLGSTMEFKWTWLYCLPPGWKFAIRFSPHERPESYQYIEDSNWILCEGGKTAGRYLIKIPGSAGTTYYWNIAVVRDVEGGWERLSEPSETRSFAVAHESTPPEPHEPHEPTTEPSEP